VLEPLTERQTRRRMQIKPKAKDQPDSLRGGTQKSGPLRVHNLTHNRNLNPPRPQPSRPVNPIRVDSRPFPGSNVSVLTVTVTVNVTVIFSGFPKKDPKCYIVTVISGDPLDAPSPVKAIRVDSCRRSRSDRSSFLVALGRFPCETASNCTCLPPVAPACVQKIIAGIAHSCREKFIIFPSHVNGAALTLLNAKDFHGSDSRRFAMPLSLNAYRTSSYQPALIVANCRRSKNGPARSTLSLNTPRCPHLIPITDHRSPTSLGHSGHNLPAVNGSCRELPGPENVKTRHHAFAAFHSDLLRPKNVKTAVAPTCGYLHQVAPTCRKKIARETGTRSLTSALQS